MKIKLILLLLLVVFLGGCSKLESQPQVVILKSSPSGDVGLVAGEYVDFQVLAEARNVKNGGDLTLVVQGADGTSLGMDGPRIVTTGAPCSFHVKVKIPATSSVTIFVPYTERGEVETKVMDRRTYKVIGSAS